MTNSHLRTATLCMVAVLLSACTGVREPAAAGTEERFDTAMTDLVPALVIADEDGGRATIRERMEHFGVPGVSVAVVDAGEIVWARGYGLADVASGREVTTETLFQAASISKPIAATAALALVDDGLVDLDADVNDYLTTWSVPESEHTDSAPVTLRGLVTHTAGLTVHGFPGYGPAETVPDTAGVLDGVGNTAPIRVDTRPRTAWRYSGGGYTVMQQLLIDVTATRFPELLRDRVLLPLGMNASTYEQPLPASRHEEAATGYRADGTPVDGNFHTYPEMAAAGLWTTPTELARWAVALQKARAGDAHPVLSPVMVEAMLSPDMNGWGLGPQTWGGGRFFGHGGSNEGFRCNLVATLDGDQALVVMTNSDRGGALGQEILLTVAAELRLAGIEPTVKEVFDLGDDLAAYAGTYRSPTAPGDVEVVVEGRGVRVVPGWEMPPMVLLPESPTDFFERSGGPSVRFVLGDDGVPMGLQGGGMTFTRVDDEPAR